MNFHSLITQDFLLPFPLVSTSPGNTSWVVFELKILTFAPSKSGFAGLLHSLAAYCRNSRSYVLPPSVLSPSSTETCKAGICSSFNCNCGCKDFSFKLLYDECRPKVNLVKHFFLHSDCKICLEPCIARPALGRKPGGNLFFRRRITFP